MSQAFSYPLRPGKFIDRALFVDLLQHIDRSISVRDAVYIGLGGPCMEDHRIIHSALGLKKLISVEREADVYAQQKFNRPLREIVCVNKDVKDFVDEFEAEMRRARASSISRRIVWFDYESPEDLTSQLQTLQALIDLANDGDVLRITLNAHASTLGGKQENESEADLKQRRMEKLVARFAGFLPEGLTLRATEHVNYPAAILESVRLAVLRATSDSGRTFLPLLVVQYADGQTMLTVTGIVLGDDSVDDFLQKTGLRDWPYFSDQWRVVEKVSGAPHLTLRERMYMDQAVLRSPGRLPARLGYLTRIQRQAAADLVGLYRRYQRFFPRFQHVDL